MRPTQSLLKTGRSAWKGPYFVPFQNLRDALANHTAIMTQARSCTILPNFVGVRFLVHNGRDYLPVLVTQDMVGHKLGEFAITKKRFTFRCVTRLYVALAWLSSPADKLKSSSMTLIYSIHGEHTYRKNTCFFKVKQIQVYKTINIWMRLR
ncbi:hypothetical protein CPC08DRAFT_643349 [Agrocybe pediades]|nr:hypothetical protein CPC08DRAFT_643349 [Agrocybe pediades]